MMEEQTLAVIHKYFKSRCQGAGFLWSPPAMQLCEIDGQVIASVQRLCGEYENAMNRKFSGTNFGALRVDSHDACNLFYQVMDDIFRDGICNWGRIAGILVYGGQLAVQAFSLGRPELVADVVNWVYSYLQTAMIHRFMTEKGGWEDLSRKFNRRLFGVLSKESGFLIATFIAAAVSGLLTN